MKNYGFLKVTVCKSFEIYPWAALSLKWFAQRTQVRFRHHFRDALPTTKFLGEKCGLGISLIRKFNDFERLFRLP